MSSFLSSTRVTNSLVETGKFRRSYKVILVGDSGVGKTTLFNRILFDKFVDTSVTNYQTSSSTGGFYRPDCFEKTENVFGEDISFFLHDFVPDRERFRPSNYYRNVDAVILVYSVDDEYTLVNLEDWMEECRNNISSEKQITWALIGNKIDIGPDVPIESIDAFAKTSGMDITCFVSAKCDTFVKESWKAVVETVHEERLVKGTGRTSSIRLVPQNTTNGQKCICRQ